MKKPMLFLGTMVLYILMANVVYAGSLNEHELSILEEASKVYEYNGNGYKADQKYIDQLKDYFLQDDIDITVGDKDIVLQLAYASIEIGVRDGYLKPIDDQNYQGEHSETDTWANSEETVKEILESVGKDISDIDSYIPSLIGDSVNINRGSLDIADVSNNSSQTSDEYNLNNDKNTTASIANKETTTGIDSKDLSAGMNRMDTSTGTNSNDDINEIYDPVNMNDEISISNATNMNSDRSSLIHKDDYNSMEDEIIKHTGFSLNRTLYIMIGLGILMIVGIFMTIKNNYFNHAYE
ncbi:MAG: hypothetical protein EWM47_09300 [Anaerolineaceae bacterium]|nr:MAG: hypothetical protein EWM47_09300 [Anaerolineaceae bacterium]